MPRHIDFQELWSILLPSLGPSGLLQVFLEGPSSKIPIGNQVGVKIVSTRTIFCYKIINKQ